MNLIVDRRLDPAERQLIQALTLKKRQSKKSHMSEKQVLARQQLADELMQVRKPTIGYTRSQSQLASVDELAGNKCRPNTKHLLIRQSKSSASLLRHHHFASSHQFLANSANTTSSCSCTGTSCVACNLSTSSSHLYADVDQCQTPATSSIANKGGLVAASTSTIASHCDTTNFHHLHNCSNHHHHHHHNHHRISSVGSSCSFSRSDSSYSGSSQDSGAHMRMILEKLQPAGASESHSLAEADTTKGTYSSELESTTVEGDARANESDQVDNKEASIKFNKSRLERLNAELEKRLYHYEYLVAQEKALLGTYNLMLFTSEGVNNFAY